VDEHKLEFAPRDLWVVPQDAMYEIAQLSDHLRASEPTTGDNEREQAVPLLGVRLNIGALQQGNNVVAQPDRVREALQGKGIGLKPREAVEGGHCAQRQDEIVVREHLDWSDRGGPDPHDLGDDIDLFNLAAPEVRPGKGRAHRGADMLRLEPAGRHLRQHRGEQQIVTLTHKRHVDTRVSGEEIAEALRRAHAPESSTENDDAPAWPPRYRRHFHGPAPQIQCQQTIEAETGDTTVQKVTDEARKGGIGLRDRPGRFRAHQQGLQGQRPNDPP